MKSKRLTMHTPDGACLILKADNEQDVRQELMEKFKEACNKLAELEDKLENGTLIETHCKVGDTVYVITTCEHIAMSYDNDFLTGTGAIECPFDDDCDYDDCEENTTRIFKTKISGIYCHGEYWCLEFKNLFDMEYYDTTQIGKTIFFTEKEAQKALQGMIKEILEL